MTKGVCRSPRTSTVELTGGSDHFESTFKSVIEHIVGIKLTKGRRHRYAKTALEILHTLSKKTSLLFVDAVWMGDLLEKAAWGRMDDRTFTVLLRFGALREEGDAEIGLEILSGQDYDVQADPQLPGGAMGPENPTPEYTLLDLVLRNVGAYGAQGDGWHDDAVYGGLITIRDIPGLRFCPPKAEFFQTLSKAMEKETRGENKGADKLFRVRKAAYDVVLAARDGWLRSTDLRQTLEDLDFPRKLYSVVAETFRSDHQCSFLKMMEILSEDRFWHPYLREAMDIWVPFHHEGPVYALRILTELGELLLPRRNGYEADKSLEKVLEDEWAAVPGRPPTELTVDLLGPLAQVTEQFKKLFFTENDRRVIIAVVEQVIPSLEKRRDDGYSGPGNDIRHVIDNLLKILREPIRSSGRRSTYW